MSELEEFQKALGRPAEAEGSLASLRKALWAFSPNTKGLLRASVVLEGQSDKGSEPKTPVVHIEPEPPAVQAAQEAHKPSTDDQEVLHRLREIEKKYRKKSDEAEKLRVRLQREEKARQEAERLRGKAEQEAAHLRRDREQAHQNAEGLRDELVKAQGTMKSGSGSTRPVYGNSRVQRRKESSSRPGWPSSSASKKPCPSLYQKRRCCGCWCWIIPAWEARPRNG
jgi:hypothetical protein